MKINWNFDMSLDKDIEQHALYLKAPRMVEAINYYLTLLKNVLKDDNTTAHEKATVRQLMAEFCVIMTSNGIPLVKKGDD